MELMFYCYVLCVIVLAGIHFILIFLDLQQNGMDHIKITKTTSFVALEVYVTTQKASKFLLEL
jgi:hypothetical protein